jgi:hypothetical protein
MLTPKPRDFILEGMTATAAARKQHPRGSKVAKTLREVALTEDDILDIMKAEQGSQSLRVFAAKMGVSAAYISDIYRGRRHPGAKVLDYFGIGKTSQIVVEYAFFMKKK